MGKIGTKYSKIDFTKKGSVKTQKDIDREGYDKALELLRWLETHFYNDEDMSESISVKSTLSQMSQYVDQVLRDYPDELHHPNYFVVD